MRSGANIHSRPSLLCRKCCLKVFPVLRNPLNGSKLPKLLYYPLLSHFCRLQGQLAEMPRVSRLLFCTQAKAFMSPFSRGTQCLLTKAKVRTFVAQEDKMCGNVVWCLHVSKIYVRTLRTLGCNQAREIDVISGRGGNLECDNLIGSDSNNLSLCICSLIQQPIGQK